MPGKGVVYFDTSALAKWYLNESFSADVERYLMEHGPVAISELAEVEMRSLLSRRRAYLLPIGTPPRSRLTLIPAHCDQPVERELSPTRKDQGQEGDEVKKRRLLAEPCLRRTAEERLGGRFHRPGVPGVNDERSHGHADDDRKGSKACRQSKNNQQCAEELGRRHERQTQRASQSDGIAEIVRPARKQHLQFPPTMGYKISADPEPQDQEADRRGRILTFRFHGFSLLPAPRR